MSCVSVSMRARVCARIRVYVGDCLWSTTGFILTIPWIRVRKILQREHLLKYFSKMLEKLPIGDRHGHNKYLRNRINFVEPRFLWL